MKYYSPLLLFVLVLVVSLFVFSPTYLWIGKVYFNLYDTFNLITLLLLSIMIFSKIKVRKSIFNINEIGSEKFLPFIVSFLSILLWVVSKKIIDINVLSAFFLMTFLYGVLGFTISSAQWRNLLIPSLLIAMTLPFGTIADLYVGFPLRMLSAKAITSLFSALHIPNVSSNTIIMIENSATQIDFSCSGMKGLWSGLLFFFAISWLEQLKINPKWILVLVFFVVSIIALNTFRVATIVYLISVLQMQPVAEMIHSPLGLFGFLFNCMVVYFIATHLLDKKESTTPKTIKPINNHCFRGIYQLTFLLIVMISSLFIKNHDKLNTMPKGINTANIKQCFHPINLSQEEKEFFFENGSVGAKFSFDIDSIKGTLLLVKSTDWRGHHNPEFCIRANGVSIQKIETKMISKDNSAKWLSLSNKRKAMYWFQSKDFITDDYSTRIWEELLKKNHQWMMVSLVIDDSVSYENPHVINLINTIKNQTHQII